MPGHVIFLTPFSHISEVFLPFFFFDAVVIEICKESSEKTDGESEGKLGIIQSGLNSDGLSLGKAQAGGQDGLMGGGLGSRRGHK